MSNKNIRPRDRKDDAEPLYVPLAKRREVERKQTESRCVRGPPPRFSPEAQ